LASLAQMAQVRYQMRRMAAGKDPALGIRPALALLADQREKSRALRRYSRWLASTRRERATSPASRVTTR
jgi:hypothetical protein